MAFNHVDRGSIPWRGGRRLLGRRTSKQFDVGRRTRRTSNVRTSIFEKVSIFSIKVICGPGASEICYFGEFENLVVDVTRRPLVDVSLWWRLPHVQKLTSPEHYIYRAPSSSAPKISNPNVRRRRGPRPRHPRRGPSDP